MRPGELSPRFTWLVRFNASRLKRTKLIQRVGILTLKRDKSRAPLVTRSADWEIRDSPINLSPKSATKHPGAPGFCS